MAAFAMTPELLDYISNEKYQEKDNWKIDDFALGPANELLISGHHLQKDDAFISINKEDSGKYNNRPELNRSFRQPQSGEQLALFLEGSSVIGLKVENALRVVSIGDMAVLKTLNWKWSPTCVCFYRGKLYAASSSSTIVSVCNLDSEEKSDIFLSDMSSDCILDIVVVMEKIYVCTKVDGRALVFSMTGSKEIEFENHDQKNAMAKSICIHERTELVFVLWNNIQIQLYSQKTSRCLRAIGMPEELHKIRVTTENILVTLIASKSTVSVYDVGEAIKFGESQNTILSSVKKKHRKKLMSNDEENLECQPANNENLRRKSDRDIQKIYDATLDLTNQKNKVTKDLEEKRSILTKKEKDCSQIEEELHTAISQKMDLAKTVTKTEELYQIIDAKEKHIQQLRMRLKKTQTEMENAKTQVIILQNKKEELEKSLSREQGRAKELKTLLSNLNERIKEQEGIRRDLVSQQQKVKDTLVQEKTHVVTKLRIVEDRNTKLEAEVTQLKKKLQAKEKTSKELQTSSLKQNERIKELEGIRRDLESRQNKLKETLVQEKGKVTREERSRVQLNERMKELEGKIMALESQQNLEESLFTEKRKVSREERLRIQLNERIKQLELTRAELEYQQKQLKQNLVIEKGKVTREERSRVQMRRRRSRENMNMPAAKIQNDEPGFTTDPATDHENIFYLSGHTSDTDTVNRDSGEEEVFDEQSSLEVCSRVSVEGATLQIADTGVSLSIPPGALSEEQTILMKIIPQPCDAQAALKFECNSVVVVELLPNNCRFQCPVSLTLPHCLQLKKEYERNSIDVLISHHEEGFKPKWELLHDARFNLCKENCTISLKSFCWVTYEIHDKIVEAKRIKLYTAGKKMRLKDRITEVEVGFYPDLPGSGKILELNKDMHLSQRKPFVFLKTGEEPLLINLHKVVPKEWNNSQPDENPKIIPFDSVSISEERSCPFVLERSGDDTDIPLCIFKVGQKGRNDVELTIRPDVLTA